VGLENRTFYAHIISPPGRQFLPDRSKKFLSSGLIFRHEPLQVDEVGEEETVDVGVETLGAIPG